MRVGTSVDAAGMVGNLVFAPKSQMALTQVGVRARLTISGVTYYWQVRAYHAGNPKPSPWATPFKFTPLKVDTPPPPPPGTYYFCRICPGFGPQLVTEQAPDYGQAESMALKNLPSGCFLNPVKGPADCK